MSVSDYDYQAFTVLFVDDETQALKYFEMAFRDTFRTATAASVKAAWTYIQEHADEIGIVISDQRMPGEKGVDLLEQVRRDYPRVVRILTTAYADLESAVDSVNRGGAFAYVNKPWELDGLQGTLKRAMEFFLIRLDRDRLVREKLSALQRMLVMDRVRGLATMVAMLRHRLRNAGPALVNYVREANLEKQIAARADDLAEIDMMRAARDECEQLIQAIDAILADVAAEAAHPDEPLDVAELVREYRRREGSVKTDLGIVMEVEAREPLAPIRGNRELLLRLLSILVNRICDMDAEDRKIRVSVENTLDNQISLSITTDSPPWGNGKVASLYSALVPFREWPMGVDMDILSAFLIAHHHGGAIQLVNDATSGPGFRVRLACSPGSQQLGGIDENWFDEVFRSVELWRSANVI